VGTYSNKILILLSCFFFQKLVFLTISPCSLLKTLDISEMRDEVNLFFDGQLSDVY